MTSKAKSKGNRWESIVLEKFRKAGITEAEKTYQPMQSAGLDPGDIRINGIKVEVKYRRQGTGFKTLRKWIEKKDSLVLCEPYQEPLVVMRFNDYANFLKGEKDGETTEQNS